MKTNTKRLIYTALFAALTCAATLSVRIPTPGTGGYIHPGDALVILTGVMLGPIPGALAAGIGSGLADLLGGYLLFAPVTFLIKGTIALLCGWVYNHFGRNSRSRLGAVAFGGAADMVLVAGGYCFYEIILYGGAAALANIPANIIQGASGLILALVLYPLLYAVPELRNFKMDKATPGKL